jgi:hypothetical protein
MFLTILLSSTVQIMIRIQRATYAIPNGKRMRVQFSEVLFCSTKSLRKSKHLIQVDETHPNRSRKNHGAPSPLMSEICFAGYWIGKGTAAANIVSETTSPGLTAASVGAQTGDTTPDSQLRSVSFFGAAADLLMLFLVLLAVELRRPLCSHQ